MTTDTGEHRLETMYPLLEEGAEPPGRRIPSTLAPGCTEWIGPARWRTRRGPAYVLWVCGRPDGALNARYPDGSRGVIRHTLDHGMRRRSSEPRRWIYGTMDIEENDVAFHDGVQPVYEPPAPDPFDLEAVLARDPAFLADLKDDRFAQAIYAVFQNRTFIEARSGRAWMCGDRQAAYLVADLRGLGESYHEYYLTDFEGTWPDDEAARVKWLRDVIPLFEGPLPIPNLRLAAGTAVQLGGTSETIRDEEHAREIEARFRSQAEQEWEEMEGKRSESASALRAALAEIERQPNRDVYDRLRAHLTRLGWRVETDDDRERAKAAARQRGVEVLQVVKQLEARPASEPPPWARAILDRRERQGGSGSLWIAVPALADLNDDEREVEFGRVPHRLDDLAVSGRIGEAEYTALSRRLSGSIDE